MNTCEIIIEREGSHFPVSVIQGDIETGHFEHPSDPSGDRKYPLTWKESEEATEQLSGTSESLDCEPDDFPHHFASRREDNNAADAYAGYRCMQADRRAR